MIGLCNFQNQTLRYISEMYISFKIFDLEKTDFDIQLYNHGITI